MEKLVIDFTGFTFEGQKIIKEFAIARLSGTSIKLEDQILIDTAAIPIDHDRFYYSQDFHNINNLCHINWQKRSNYTPENLLQKLKNLRKENLPIYVRDNTHAIFLAEYMNIPIDSLIILEDLGLNPLDLELKTCCSNHTQEKSYCVKNNVMNMAEWLKEKLKNSSTKKFKLAVINYIGIMFNNDDGSEELGITKMRVHCFDGDGTTIANKLLAANSAVDSKNATQQQLDQYYSDFENRNAIVHSRSNVLVCGFKSQLNKILRDNKIDIIFVDSRMQKNYLKNSILDPSFKVFALEDYGFRGDVNMTPDPDNNVKKMIDWVVNEIFCERILHESFEIPDENMSNNN